MKILMVNKFLYPNGGSETYVFELGKQLETMGHEVQYFGMADERNIVGNSSDSYTKNMSFHGGYLAKLSYPFKIIYSIEARKKIGIILNKFKPDIVHLNNFNFQLTPSIIYEIKKHHIPIVYTAHDYQLICPNHMCLDIKTGMPCEACIEKGFGQCCKRKCIHGSFVKSLLGTIEAKLYKALGTYRYIDQIICPSEFMKRLLDTHAELRDRTVTMHNFIVQSEEQQQIPVRNDRERYVLYFGRYEKEKGVKTLIEVCKQLPDVKFAFAGKGSLAQEIEKLPNAINYGFLEKSEVSALIKGAEFTICPSEWYENCPFSVMESISNGTPVIGANIGGIPELIQNEVNGLLYHSGDLEECVSKIAYLWNNLDVCQQYSCVCLQDNFYSCSKYVEELLNLYKEQKKRIMVEKDLLYNNEKEDGKNYFLYLLKGLGAIGVVFMHAQFPGMLGKIVTSFFSFCIPIFFMISGYYSYISDEEELKRCLRRRTFHVFKLCIFYISFYFCFEALRCFIGSTGEWKTFFSNVFKIKNLYGLVVLNSTQFLEAGHLWYIVALLYTYLFYQYIYLKTINLKCWNLVIVLLLLFNPVASLMGLTMNAYFCGIPFFMTGNLIKKWSDGKRITIDNRALACCVLIFGLISVAQPLLLYEELVAAYMHVLYSLALFLLAVANPLTGKNNIVTEIGKFLSAKIYLFHVMIITCIGFIYNKYQLDRYIIFEYLWPLFILFTTTGFSKVLYLVEKQYNLWDNRRTVVKK